MKDWSPIWFVLPPFLVVASLLWFFFFRPFEFSIDLENTVPLPRPELVRIDVFLDNIRIGTLIPNTRLGESLRGGMPKKLTLMCFNENQYSVKTEYDLQTDHAVVTVIGCFDLPQVGQSIGSVSVSWRRLNAE
jgi:hypothetical protein